MKTHHVVDDMDMFHSGDKNVGSWSGGLADPMEVQRTLCRSGRPYGGPADHRKSQSI